MAAIIPACSFPTCAAETRTATFALTTDYPSLQAAIDANPGGIIEVPPGDHSIAESLMIQHKNTVLRGFGRIVQTNSDAAIVRVEGADGVVLQDVTLARPADSPDSSLPAVSVESSDHVRVDSIRVLDNRSYMAAIRFSQSSYGRIENSFVLNYKRIGIDDRTHNPVLGYAFRCIDGTGIGVTDSLGTMILNNQIIERRLLPTKENMEKLQLGKLVEGQKPSTFGELGKGVQKAGFAKHWHQGSAIAVTGPETTTFTHISGNYIENAAQGIDIHSDNFICTENTVFRGMMGMKAMHGSKYGIISRNIFSHVDNWGIMLGPGAASRAATAAGEEGPARKANTDGSVVVSNNVISDFGRGLEFWNWGGEGPDAASTAVFRFERGQLSTNPSLSNVLVEGNVVTNSETELGPDGEPVHPKPRYAYAVIIDVPPPVNKQHNYPEKIRIINNLFEPGQNGISNVEVPSSN